MQKGKLAQGKKQNSVKKIIEREILKITEGKKTKLKVTQE